MQGMLGLYPNPESYQYVIAVSSCIRSARLELISVCSQVLVTWPYRSYLTPRDQTVIQFSHDFVGLICICFMYCKFRVAFALSNSATCAGVNKNLAVHSA